jgi:tetratricopeptide (TPR) repeat protein
MRALAAASLATLLAVGTPPAPATGAGTPAERAPLAERLGWNARERTAAGLEAHTAGDSEHAAEAFDRALRLRPEDPRTLYNAGTARIGVDDRSAADRLEAAARSADERLPELAPDAFYNLGNARLSAGDAAGAVAAYREALLRAPGRNDVKHNLELALRRLEPPPQDRGTSAPRAGGEGGHEGEEKRGHGSPEEDRERPGPDDEERDPQAPDAPSAAGEDGEGDGGAREPQPGEAPPSPLPQFRDLPDLTAEQAAALLRAVENLERRQRRERALEQARARGRTEIDW